MIGASVFQSDQVFYETVPVKLFNSQVQVEACPPGRPVEKYWFQRAMSSQNRHVGKIYFHLSSGA